MNKTKSLTVDEMLLCRDIINTITDDPQLLRGFRKCVNTNNRQLTRVSNKLDTLAKVQLNGGSTTPAPKREQRKTGEHSFVDCGGYPRCATCGCDEDDAYVGGQKCTFKQ